MTFVKYTRKPVPLRPIRANQTRQQTSETTKPSDLRPAPEDDGVVAHERTEDEEERVEGSVEDRSGSTSLLRDEEREKAEQTGRVERDGNVGLSES